MSKSICCLSVCVFNFSVTPMIDSMYLILLRIILISASSNSSDNPSLNPLRLLNSLISVASFKSRKRLNKFVDSVSSASTCIGCCSPSWTTGDWSLGFTSSLALANVAGTSNKLAKTLARTLLFITFILPSMYGKCLYFSHNSTMYIGSI